MSPEVPLLTVKLQVGHESCQEYDNKLVCYDHNTKGFKKRKNNTKDTACHGKNIQEKRVRLFQENNQQFANNMITTEQLELQIKELEKELEKMRNNDSTMVM